MRAASLFTLITAIAISGCSIKQTVTPATLSAELAPEICMIPALNLRAGFTSAYQASLVEKGFRTRLMAPGSSPDRSEERRVGKECRARWSRQHGEGS